MNIKPYPDKQHEWGENVDLTVLCRGVEFDLTVGRHAMRIAGDGSDVSIQLTVQERIFTKFLLLNPDNGYLQSDIKDNTPIGSSTDVSSVYKSTIKSFGSHMIRENFIQFDRGRSSKYSVLENSRDPKMLIKRESELVKLSSVSERRKSKRLRQIEHLNDFYNGSSNHEFSKKKLVGAGMIATGSLVVIGGVAYGVYRKVEHE